MVVDDKNWNPLSVDDLAAIFRRLSIPWWISGGWALDLFLGRETREHQDTDVLILRRDHLVVQEYLEKDWQLFKTKQPGLAPWPHGEFLETPVNCFWVRRHDTTWAFEVMLMETEGDYWVYRRLPSVRGKIAQMGFVTDSGIPYLSPEIQLLYKSGPNRRKDSEDLKLVLPRLPSEKVQWLLDGLRMQYLSGHDWIGYIERFLAAGQ